MSTAVTTLALRFHVGLNVANLANSVRFYRLLLDCEPARDLNDYARFELEQPPLVLALYPSAQAAGGPLNHVGLRFPSSEALVAVQRRLEEAGIATQRQEGVECCYARQTKFWVTDPDRTLWEIYTLHEDIEHSGFDDPPAAAAAAPQAVWAHRLTEPLSARVPHVDGSLDEVRLEGTFNADAPAGALTAFLGDVFRALKPGGRVSVHGLVGDKALPGNPNLPGLASLVQRVPAETEALAALENAGFCSLFYEKLGDIHCFSVDGVELRELLLQGLKPAAAVETWACPVMYKGPLAQVVDEDGTEFRRGVRVLVKAAQAERLRKGQAADQFAYLPR
jgi:catechol 2,3-dioxygenase-like lactoylglutathione lyase family enzyme